MKAELKKISTWSGKGTDIRFYIGSLHVGTATPFRHEPEVYMYDNFYPVIFTMSIIAKRTFEDIKIEVELAGKEFLKQIAK